MNEKHKIFTYIEEDNLEKVKELVEGGLNINNIYNVDEEGITPLMSATGCQDKSILEYLLSKGADLSQTSLDRGDNILTWCSKWGTWDNFDYVVEKLKEKDIFDINFQNNEGSTATIIAVAYGDDKMLKKILSHNPDLSIKDEDGMNALGIAYRDQVNDREEVRKIITLANMQQSFNGLRKTDASPGSTKKNKK